MNSQTCFSRTSCKQSSAQSFIFMGLLFMLVMGSLHGLGVATAAFTIGEGFTNFMAPYLMSIIFLAIGLGMNRRESKEAMDESK